VQSTAVDTIRRQLTELGATADPKVRGYTNEVADAAR
jgi:hypothetical protein